MAVVASVIGTATVCMLPIAPLEIGAGALFGFWQGWAVCFVA